MIEFHHRLNSTGVKRERAVCVYTLSLHGLQTAKPIFNIWRKSYAKALGGSTP